jgi:phosphoglycerate dehydrogenase-like enzyme
MKVLIALKHRFELWHWPEWATERLRQHFPALQFALLRDFDRYKDELKDTDVLLSWQLRPDQFAEATRLRWIHSPAAAVHQLIFPELVRSPVVITNSSSVHGAPVAEHALAMMLAMARAIPGCVRYQLRKQWSQQELWSSRSGLSELRGSTVLIVGLGHIGSYLARLLKALGAHVIGIREHPEKGPAGCDEVFGPDGFDEVIPRANYVVLAAPVTPKTEALINMERLQRMRPGARLINVGRGSLIDEPALVEAVQRGTIAGAALDVFEEEPLPAESPLWELESVLISPHLGSATAPMWERQLDLFEENLRRFMAGEPLVNIVDKQRGY